MKVAFHTLGCKVNSYESQAMLNMFEEAGYEEVDFKEVADVYVVNTCTVTNTGDSKSRQMIRKAIRKNPQATVCVVGCYSQVAPQDIEAIEGVSIILGTQFRNEIVDLVEKYQQTHERIVKVSEVKQLRKFEDLNIDRFLHTRAYLKIQDGCNNFCTYCIIPYARGRVRSRKPESVIKQAKELVAKGYVEIVLTGIHTAGYGEDLENYSFYDLLVDLTKIEGLKRLRISSIETSQITDDIIDLISKSKIIVDHLHVPLQAGCDETLKRMNRKYNCEQYYEKLSKIRRLIPDIVFTTDVIVGFPGESEEEFEKTYEFIKKVGYTQLHVFPYSMRKGTPAARMVQVDEKIKHERVNRLIALSHELNENYAKLYDAADRYAIYSHDTNENNSDKAEYSYEKIRMLTDNIASFLNGKNIISWTDKGGYKVCYMKYKKKVPFGMAGFGQNFYHQMVVSEYAGKSMLTDETAGDEDVYITETGKVYHTHSDCTYLKPSVKRVFADKIDGMRNLSGGKYKRCEHCLKYSKTVGAYIYITDYGDRYHMSGHCSGIKRNIKKVKKSKVGGMSECNKCMERG